MQRDPSMTFPPFGHILRTAILVNMAAGIPQGAAARAKYDLAQY